jgi:hypothetical protein
MRSFVYLLTEIGKAILFVCAVALPAIAAWGLFLILAYHAKAWLAGSFWYVGIAAVAWLFLCWRSPQPRRTLSDLWLQSFFLFAFLLILTVFRRVTAHPGLEVRDIVFLISSVLLMALVFGIAIRRRLRSSRGSNQTLQPTAGRSDV